MSYDIVKGPDIVIKGEIRVEHKVNGDDARPP
jgi:hypothetical protein